MMSSARTDKVEQGQAQLRDRLASTNTHPATVSEFGREFGLCSFPRCAGTLQLLDLLRVPRAEVHQELLMHLVDKLLVLLPTLSPNRQLDFLQRSFKFIARCPCPELEDVPLRLLERLPQGHVPPQFLEELGTYLAGLRAQPELRERRETLEPKFSVALQRQVWERSPPLFKATVRPLLQAHLHHRLEQRAAGAGRRRATTGPVDDLVKVVGPSRHLFVSVFRLVVEQLAQDVTGEFWTVERGTWGVLLSDLLLALRRAENADRQHVELRQHQRLASLLDLSVREGQLRPRDLAAVQGVVRAILAERVETAGGPAGVASAAVAAAATAGAAGGGEGGGIPATPLHGVVAEALDQLDQLDNKQVFAMPVTDDIAPGYSRMITRPMDLATMRKTTYASLQHLHADVELLVTNCQQYNGRRGYYGEYASKFAAAWRRLKPSLQAKLTARPARAAKGHVAGQKRALPASNAAASRAIAKAANDAALEKTASKAASEKLTLLPPMTALPPSFPLPDADLPLALALMLLSQPAVVALLGHAVAQAVDGALTQRALPHDQPVFASALQLLDMAVSAPTLRLRISSPSAATLRVHLTKLVQLLGEVRFCAKAAGGKASAASLEERRTPELRQLVQDDQWRSAFALPLFRRVAQAALCGSLLQATADPQRGLSLAHVAARGCSAAMAHDRHFAEALVTACVAQRSAVPRQDDAGSQLREAVLALFEALVRCGGVSCVAHEQATRLLAVWVQRSVVSPAWLRPTLQRLVQASRQDIIPSDDARPAKRARHEDLSALGLGPVWGEPHFTRVRVEYLRLAAVAKPQLDLAELLKVPALAATSSSESFAAASDS